MNVFAIRHGETAWSCNGQDTGTTDIPLTDNGRRVAERMRPVLARNAFELAFCSPIQRARETCKIAGWDDGATIEPDLLEWNYGDHEGMTPEPVQERAPGWSIFRDGCPAGEASEHMDARVDRVIARSRAITSDPAMFAHGHVLRVWRAGSGCRRPAVSTLLNTGTVCVSGFYPEIAAVRIWNERLVE